MVNSELLVLIEPFCRHFLISYVVFINAFYAFVKTQNLKVLKKRGAIVFGINVGVSILYSILMIKEMIALSQMISYAGIVLTLSLLCREKNISLVIGLICAGYSHLLKLCSYYISSIIIYFLFGPILNIIPHIIVCVVSIVLNLLLMRIKRLRNGIQFFEKSEFLGIGLVISGLIVLFSLIGYEMNMSEIIVFIVAICIMIVGFGLYLWIKKGITKHYREKQQLKFDIQYREMLEQKEDEIEQLNRSNEYLSKIVHRDNHLMSSLSTAIDTYKKTNSDDDKERLLDEMQTLINERGELIQTELKESKLFPSTGNNLIDSTINEFYIKAAAHGIDFDISVSATVDEVIGKYISQTDLHTLICDHIKDAIIAVDAKNENNGKILVELSMENDNYTITIFDSGVDFEIDTLAKLGKERVTTHADNGGSGIGFMTTFETLRKSYASLIITEFANKTPFSKSVSIRFDGNTAFIIQSYRKEELQSVLNRDDILLL